MCVCIELGNYHCNFHFDISGPILKHQASSSRLPQASSSRHACVRFVLIMCLVALAAWCAVQIDCAFVLMRCPTAPWPRGARVLCKLGSVWTGGPASRFASSDAETATACPRRDALAFVFLFRLLLSNMIHHTLGMSRTCAAAHVVTLRFCIAHILIHGGGALANYRMSYGHGGHRRTWRHAAAPVYAAFLYCPPESDSHSLGRPHCPPRIGVGARF
jgi:hypothetical protein